MAGVASAVRDLVEMGFTRANSEEALAKAHGNKETALGILLGSASMSPPDPSSLRAPGACVALLHISGTAYINSLLQAYFAIPVLAKAVLSFSTQPDIEPDLTRDSTSLLFSLQRLFAQLALSERKAVDPSPVLARMRDDAGKQVFIGDESYMGEFNMWFVSQLEDGLKVERSSGQGVFLDFGTLRHKESFRSLSESEMITDSILSKLFFGKLSEQLHFDGETVTKETLFAQFPLNSATGELISSWQATMSAVIPDYRISSGEVRACEQFTWISALPKVLLFQISNEPSEKAFRYPLQLYADQFLLSNADRINSLRKEADRIKQKVAFLQKKLEKMENFKQSRQNLEEILKLADVFLTDQRTNMDYTVLDDDQVQVYSPAYLFGVTEEAKEQLKSVSMLLDQYMSRTKATILAIKGKIAELNSQLERLYSSPELRRHPYRLHAVLSHEGSSNGCYSVFIHSADLQQWRKLSDEVVTVVAESRVLEEGGSKCSRVYGLMYLAEELAQGWGADSYEGYIPSSIKSTIRADNLKLQRETDDKQLASLYSQITTLYTERQALASLQLSSSTRPYPDILNFPIYLKTRQEEMLSRWVILDLCVLELTAKSLTKVAGEPLGLKLKTMSVNQAVISLRITGTEERRVKELLRQYEEGYKDAMTLEFILARLNELDYLNAYKGFSLILGQSSPGKNQYRTHARELADIVALRLTSEARNCYLRLDIEAGIQLLKLLGALTYISIDEKLLLFRQITNNLETIGQLLGKEKGRYGAIVEDLVRRIKAQDPGFLEEFTSSSSLIDGFKEKLKEYSGYKWVAGWQSDQLPSRLSAHTRTFQGQYAPWVDMQGRLKRTGQLVPDSVREELEMRADYLLKSP